jgi:nicotinate-nucleotide--dimethylbenzimidazole phosphoribosyltransferase
MSLEEVNAAVERGKAVAADVFMNGCNTIGFGEMGIGNTSAASLIMSAVTGIPLEECVGRGTGSNDEQLRIKIETLKGVYQKHQLSLFADKPIDLLSAAELKMIIVVDGFIATAALLIAKLLSGNNPSLPPFKGWGLIFAHSSGEQGHQKMLDYLKAKPLLQLGMRLGEGTGAALAMPLIQSAVNFLNEMASFESAGVSEKV